jgi:periplasmic protein TonB
VTVAKTVLPAEHDPALWRWLLAGAAVILVHAAIVFWILYIRDLQSAGAPPAAMMIELAPLDVAPPTESPAEVTPGPQMTEAQPEEVEPQQTIPVPELAPAPKPDVVLITPHKPKPKPKKIEKEIPKSVVKREREPPAPRTSAPPRASAAASRAASSRAASASAAAAARSACAAGLGSLNKHYPEAARARGEQGTVRLALTISRDGRVQSARVIGSSGSSALDQAALQMARNASCPAMETSANFILPVRFAIR